MDLDGEGRVYFWPMLYHEKVSVVMQFAVIEHNSYLEEEDGTFNATDPIHVQALEKLFAMVSLMFDSEEIFQLP